MAQQQPRDHHYVPEWYQRRFFAPSTIDRNFYVLDKSPAVHQVGHRRVVERAISRKGPARCFVEPHFYSLKQFGVTSTDIETQFFGELDRLGAPAVAAYRNFVLSDATITAFNPLVRYMSAQKLRTPKGLDFIARVTKRAEVDRGVLLIAMAELHQLFVTVWYEAVWEVVCYDNSPTKFLLTDHPVATYNKEMFPESELCRYPFDAPIECIGTHTLFPLDQNRCLILTNLQYARDSRANKRAVRANSRAFAQSIKHLGDIQAGRQISEQWVLSINHILKTTAKRYIAAEMEEWLFPERHLDERRWNHLGGPLFLMPDPRKLAFSSSIIMGLRNGGAWGMDEYGRSPLDDPAKAAQRDAEFRAHHREKARWDQLFGPLSPEELRRFPEHEARRLLTEVPLWPSLDALQVNPRAPLNARSTLSG